MAAEYKVRSLAELTRRCKSLEFDVSRREAKGRVEGTKFIDSREWSALETADYHLRHALQALEKARG